MHQNNLKIFYPLKTGKDNKILRTVCEEVEKITPEIKEFGKILLDLMREYDGVGLAAPQIWENIRMIATTQRKKFPNEKNPDKDFLWETLLINPEIINTSKEMQTSEEACLSLPWDRGFVQRHQRVEVKYQDLKGKTHQQKYSGFNACIIQHEIDHLNWVLFIDKLIKEEKNWL